MIELTKETIAFCAQAGRMPEAQLTSIFYRDNENAVNFMTRLVQNKLINRDIAGNYIGSQYSRAYLPLGKTIFQSKVVNLLPEDLAAELNSIPVYQFGDGVTVASADPTDPGTLKILEKYIDKQVSTVFSFPDEIASAVKIQYTNKKHVNQLITQLDYQYLNSISQLTDHQLVNLLESKQVLKIADTILLFAIKERSSDIHIEPKKQYLLIRFRIDGLLRNALTLPPTITLALISRYKLLSNMDIANHRMPQDGRFEFVLPHKHIDIRASTLPNVYGEKIVLRLLGSDTLDNQLEFKHLGFSHEVASALERAVNMPHGMVIVTGPTGSGKTTTLHSILNHLNGPNINIVTIEDPIEYEHPDITQVAVNKQNDLDFACVLKGILRQDPDVIMVGEIRDPETAKISANAALTGHLVLTSLHTNNATQAIIRMTEMGVDSYIVAPSIIGVLGQRLIRKLCDFCKVSYQPEVQELSKHFHWDKTTQAPRFFRAIGCEYCGGSGFHGRIAIHEFLWVDYQIRQCLLQGGNHTQIQAIATANGHFKDLRYDGFKKALLGYTTLNDIVRATLSVNSDYEL